MGRNCKKYLSKLEKTLPMQRLYEYGRGRALKGLGCLHQLHNLVRHNTPGLLPQRRKRFAAITIGGNLFEFDMLEFLQNNQTGWNS
jgi:hypothetical protein